MSATDVTPFIWFDADIGEVCSFYEGIFDDFELVRAMRSDSDDVVGFTVSLGGHELSLFNGGPGAPHSNAFSLMVHTDDQAETDRLWDALREGGGEELACGWLQDRYGIRWQIVPRRMMEILSETETPPRKRAFEAMLTMTKLNHAEIEAAYNAES